MSIRTIIAALSVVPGLAFDMGPTFDADYAGEDYNVTLWHTPPSGSANNYEAAAKACEVGMQDANAFHPVHPASVYATHTHTHTHTPVGLLFGGSQVLRVDVLPSWHRGRRLDGQ